MNKTIKINQLWKNSFILGHNSYSLIQNNRHGVFITENPEYLAIYFNYPFKDIRYFNDCTLISEDGRHDIIKLIFCGKEIKGN